MLNIKYLESLDGLDILKIKDILVVLGILLAWTIPLDIINRFVFEIQFFTEWLFIGWCVIIGVTFFILGVKAGSQNTRGG